MICSMDKLETVSPSPEETCHEDGEPGGEAAKKEAKENAPLAAGQTEDSFYSTEEKPPVAAIDEPVIKDPMMEIVDFNLNNEVVKMRKEVKRVRALIIRKLTRRMAALKKKKGKEADIERNQRRATRLLEEIQAMKILPPDVVTKTALQKNLNLNQVCKNPKSTISDRGLTRIATHPQFVKRIDSIKAAVKAFKEGRVKNKGQEGTVKGRNKMEKFPPAKEGKNVKKKQETTVEQLEVTDGDNMVSPLREAAVENPKEERSKADTAEDKNKKMPEKNNVNSAVKNMKTNNIPGPPPEQKPNCDTASKVLRQKTEEEESDLEPLDDEEKEYFDDSTEERFHRQSSESGESDEEDDFFVGKVSKVKKKTKKNPGDRKKEVKVSPSKQEQSELPVVEPKVKAKAAQLQTVLCPTLSGMDKSAGRGRGKDKHGGRETVKGVSQWKSNANKQSMFQKQGRGTDSGSQGRRDVVKQKVSKDGADRNHQDRTQALHPSWEASKKRKEQQGQILAFQGKKIKFDDDDD